jgi:hypothetical protein
MPNRHASYAVNPALIDTRKFNQNLPIVSTMRSIPRIEQFDTPRINENHRDLIPSPHSNTNNRLAKRLVGRGV